MFMPRTYLTDERLKVTQEAAQSDGLSSLSLHPPRTQPAVPGSYPRRD